MKRIENHGCNFVVWVFNKGLIKHLKNPYAISNQHSHKCEIEFIVF